MDSDNLKSTTAQRALRISELAASLGFDWNSPLDVLDKLLEEISEIREAVQNGAPIEHVSEEVGDLYFALVNFNRKMHIDSDTAFNGGVAKFERRFSKLEKLIQDSGHQVSELSQDELEAVWQRVKQGENHGR